MPPLAGKPPYATDEPDSAFGPPQQPQRRMRQPAPEDPNKRTSAYDVYDNYIKKDEQAASPLNTRNSGIGNLLLNMGDDSDDSDDEDDRRPANPPGITNVPKQQPQGSPSKTAALPAAVAVTAPLRSTSRAAQQAQQLQQQQPIAATPRLPQGGPPSPPRQQQPIAAPRPGYAAPIAALNGQAGAGSGPHVVNARGPPVAPQARPPFAAAPAPGSSAAPHPLQPPITPISPAFIRPSSAASSASDKIRSSPGVKFSTEKPRPILRGNTEETLLPSRGEKGDDFWRRFSIVAKEPDSKDESSWLKKSQNRSNQMTRYVWIIGIFLIVVILGGIGIGIYLSRNSPGHQQPTAIGGSADHSLLGTTTTTPSKVSPTKAGAPTNSIKHISPTNTVARRALVQPTLVSRHFAKRQNAVR